MLLYIIKSILASDSDSELLC